MVAEFLESILDDLKSVDEKVAKAFKIKPGNLSKFAHVETESVQKYLHPALVLFSGRLLGYTGSRLVSLAAVIQLIYLASAVQFRVPDNCVRNPVEEDLKDGAQLPVLAGDYLYGRFFVELCAGEILQFLNPLASVIADMNYGALQRRKHQGLQATDMKMALFVIEKESAALTEGAARMAGALAAVSGEAMASISGIGFNLGMGYGIMERNLGTELAVPYFEAAGKLLQRFPAGEARDGLAGLVNELKNGQLAVPLRKTGQCGEFKNTPPGGLEIPEGYRDREQYVHSVFSFIAHKYDTMNTFLSFNRDKFWRKFTVEKAGIRLGDHVLDVCCGTGMISVELAKKAGPSGRVTGLDFCGEMLDIAKTNLKGMQGINNIEYIQGNAMEMPFPDNTFDCATIGFGLRNVPDLKKTLREIIRVIKPGGRVVCLEFSKPTVPFFKQLYNFYFNRCVPFLGRLGAGIEGPYRYLHNSWQVFPHQKELKDEFTRQGLENVNYYELTGGVVSVHVGVKPVSVISNVAAAKE